MKKLLLALSLLTTHAYACSTACETAVEAAKAATTLDESECLLSDTVCYEFTDDETGKYGLKDKDDNIIVPAKYDDISVAYYHYYSEYAPYLNVRITEENKTRHGLLDEKGKVLFMGNYDTIMPTKDGLVIVTKDEMYGMVDLTGKTILPTIYDALEVSDSGMIIGRQVQYTMIDHKGKKLIQYPYLRPLNTDKATFCELLADEGQRCGIVDKTGEVIVPPIYLSFRDTYDYDTNAHHQTLIWAVNNEGKYGLIDLSIGKPITPFKYDEVHNFFEGVTSIVIDDKHGFIDENGKEVIKPIYDYAYSFDAGLAKVEKDGEWFYIDKTGKRVP